MPEGFRNNFTATLVQNILNKVDNNVAIKGHNSFTEELVSVIETMPLTKQFGKTIKNSISTLITQWQNGLGAPETQASILGWVKEQINKTKIPADYSSQIASRAFQILLSQYKSNKIENVLLQSIFEEQVQTLASNQLCVSYADSAEFTKHIDNIVMGEIVVEWKANAEDGKLTETQMLYLTELFTSKLTYMQKAIMDVTSTSKLAAEVKELRTELSAMRAAMSQLFKLHGKELPSFAKSHGVFSGNSRTVDAHIVNVTLNPENSNNADTTSTPGSSG